MSKLLLMVALILGASAYGETNEVACAQSSEAPARVQCEALTKSGTQCKRKAIPDGKLCRQHQKIAEKKAKESSAK